MTLNSRTSRQIAGLGAQPGHTPGCAAPEARLREVVGQAVTQLESWRLKAPFSLIIRAVKRETHVSTGLKAPAFFFMRISYY